MIKYGVITVEQKVAEEITCDVCGKRWEFNSKDGDNIIETQEFQHMRFMGGYGSVFGDESEVSLDICQHCLKDKLGEYFIIE